MRIYKLKGDFDKYQTCSIDYIASLRYLPKECSGFDTMITFDGTPQKEHWFPRVIARNPHKGRKLGDYISCLSSPVFLNTRAIETLKPIIGNFEVLPLICDFGDYYAVNDLNLLDCINYDEAEPVLFDKGAPVTPENIMYFKRYSFHAHKLNGCHVFRIVELARSVVFVDDVFRKECEKHNIAGFAFDLVWLDEPLEELKKPGRGSMTEEDFAYIEESLDIILPEMYKAALRNNRLWKYELDMHILADPREIVKLNQRMRKKLPGGVRLKPEHFVFSYHNGETFQCRFLDLSNPNSPVYLFLRGKWKYNPDTLEGYEECDSLDAYISGILERKGFSEYEKKCAEI